MEGVFKLLLLFGGMGGICLGGIYLLRMMPRRPSDDSLLEERLADTERRLAESEQRMGELEERADFAERMLTELRDRPALPPGRES